ncbi:MAG: recombinase family protein, partial [Dechloromonas sp.]
MPAHDTSSVSDSTPLSQPVVIYTRVSTENQVGGRFDSCESQAAVCREQIERHSHEGWHEVACLTDAAYSGGTMERPGIKTLKRMIEAGEVKIVLIYKLERVLRSTDEWVPFRAFLKKHGCRLESATEDLSESTPSGRLKNNLMMSFSQYERENTAEKTSQKMLQQAKRGLWNGGQVPFGYNYDKNTQTLHVHPEEAKIVRRIFEQAARMVSLTDLANDLNAEGLRTKERVWARRDGTQTVVGGCKFRSDGLRLLLKNPIYRGSVKFAGNHFAGKHEAVVTADLWDKA